MALIEDVNDEAHPECQVHVQGSLQSLASDWPRSTPTPSYLVHFFTPSPHSSGHLRHRFMLYVIDGIA
jgi:hypothetical protein